MFEKVLCTFISVLFYISSNAVKTYFQTNPPELKSYDVDCIPPNPLRGDESIKSFRYIGAPSCFLSRDRLEVAFIQLFPATLYQIYQVIYPH